MKHFMSRLALAMGLILSLALVAPHAHAQVNPTEQSVTEDSLFEALGTSGTVTGRITIPDDNAGALINPQNRSWANFLEGTMFLVSVIAVVGMLAILVLFYLMRGKIRVEGGLSGRKILRFNWIERFAHWTLALTFIILALSGLNLIVGTSLLLPVIGEGAFGTLSAWGKIAHNYLAWPFMAALVLILVLWVVDNIPNRLDGQWLAQGGGLLKNGVHPPAKKFNAGQKIIFWSVVIGGAALSFTGVMLLFPAEVATFADWQLYQTIHAVTAAVLSAIIIAHIYIGSVGMEGAFEAMGSGEVDENWAKEHHSLWVEEVKGETAPKARPHPAE